MTDVAGNPVNFQNKTPSEDCLVLLNQLGRPVMYGLMHMSTMFFSPEPGSKNKDGKRGRGYDEIFVLKREV